MMNHHLKDPFNGTFASSIITQQINLKNTFQVLVTDKRKEQSIV